MHSVSSLPAAARSTSASPTPTAWRSWRRRTPIGAERVVIEAFRGSRLDLLPLFARADDSAAAIRVYLDRGDVLVARVAQRIVGHVQLVGAGADWEITSVAVAETHQGRGIGAALVRAALDRAFGAGADQVLVATAAADIGNLRFYQRLGFRMDRIERDVFSADRGYPALEIDGIRVRDRVWFSIDAPDCCRPEPPPGSARLIGFARAMRR